jgi:hypothetical protein
MVLVAPGTSTNGPVVVLVAAHIGSVPTPSRGFIFVTDRSTGMIKDLAHRTWRIAVTVGPLVAIALTLAAGMKWR